MMSASEPVDCISLMVALQYSIIHTFLYIKVLRTFATITIIVHTNITACKYCYYNYDVYYYVYVFY